MRVLFVFPDLAANVTDYSGVLSPAVALLAGMLKEHGHEVELYHFVHEPTEEDFRARVREASAQLVAFSINSHYRRRIVEWSHWAHDESGAPVIVGGVHATLAPQEVASIETVHYTCVGEGEQALLELCERLENGGDTSNILSLWVRGSEGNVIQNDRRPLVRNLDDLPDPDYGIFDVRNLYNSRMGIFPFLMSRGCSFKCTYCSIPAMLELSGERESSFWRFLSPERAVNQLRSLLDEHMPEAKKIHFLDAIAFSSRRWLKEFARLYKERIGLPFSCNLRADYVTPETARILADMNCEIVRFGVESGDEDMNNRVLDRGLSIEKIRKAFELLRDVGIQRLSYNLVGLPEENIHLALKTVRLNADLDPDIAIAFIFYPYPGTRLHELCRQQGFLTDREYDNYFIGVVTDIPTFKATDILFVHRFFHQIIRVYGWGDRMGMNPEKWANLVDRVITSPIFPRAIIVRLRERYKSARHDVGERLVQLSPALYRALGGTGPASVR